MRYILTLFAFFLFAYLQAQPSTRIKLTQLEQSKTVEGSKAGQIPLTNSAGDLRYAQYVEVDLVKIGFVPAYTGNTSNYSEFVVASDSSRWYIDWQGRGFPLGSSGSGTDKNGYYGGNAGNGGDATIPSSTISTITNQFTFYKPGVTDFDDLTPVRFVVDSGNESPFMAFRQGNDSMLVKRSDTEFAFTSQRGIFVQSGENIGLVAGGIVTLQGDSITIQTVPTAFPQERTFLTYSPGLYITKKEGIDSTDLNFDAIQNLTATGAGPTSYNITLSDGGAVTLIEGTNVNLTRSGNNITINATGGGGGGQTFDNTSTSTTHLLSLSGAGGSIQFVEGTGIGLATTGTLLDGILTISNTAPDQVVSITGAGISVVTGTYPNFVVTSTEIDGLITNEGALTVAAGTATTSIINSNTSGSTGVTLTASTGLSISEAGNVITLTNSAPDQVVSITGAGISIVTGTYPNFIVTSTEIDGSISNELQAISASGAGPTSYDIGLNLGGGSVTLTEGTNIDLTRVGNNITINSTAGGGQTFDNSSTSTTHLLTLTGAGGSIQFVEGTGIGLATTGTLLNGILTITNSSPDQVVSITGAGISIVTGTYPNFIVTSTEIDGSISNELQAISASGAGPTSYDIGLNLGGGSVTLAEGANVDLTRSGNTITIASALNNSIYTADGIVFADCDATLQSGKYFQFDWFGGNTAFEVNDLTLQASLKSKDTRGSIQLDNSSMSGTRWNAGFTQYGQWYVSDFAAELDFNNLSVFQVNQFGFQCISTTTTFQPPPMTTAQRTAIIPILDGSIVYDTDLDKFEFYENGVWVTLFTPSSLYYQTIKVNGASQPQENFVNYVNTPTVEFTGTDVPGSAWTKIEANVPANGIGSTQLATGAVTSGKILDGTIAAVDLGQMGATTGQAMVWNGTAWAPSGVAGSTTITDFTASGTYTVPAGAKTIEVTCVGGGGAGASGRKGAAGTVRGGGGGGSAGAISTGTFSISALGNPGSITVTVGTGGTGGASQAGASTDGNDGTAGGETSCSISGTKFILAGGGNFGAKGTTSSGVGGALRDLGDFASKAGANGGSTGNASSAVASVNKTGGSGGGGGGITAANSAGSAGFGAAGYYGLNAGGNPGNVGSVNGLQGTAPTIDQLTGGGGGGGYAQTGAGSGGNGAAGRLGAGGGGGGAATDTLSNSGAGGNGGDGFVRIIATF